LQLASGVACFTKFRSLKVLLVNSIAFTKGNKNVSGEKGKTNIKLLQNNTANVINVPYAQIAIRHHRSVHKHELPSYLFSGSERRKFNFLKFLFNLTFCYLQQKVAANQLM